jgi:dTDP-4-amino-4,6-dideoxy-D-glucose ammonia-lyase
VTTAAIHPLLLGEGRTPLTPDALDFLRAEWTPLFLQERIVEASANRATLDRWTALAFRIVRAFSDHPFETQAAISRELALDRNVLVRLNRVLRRSDLAQELIVQRGQAAKYWQNTIAPMARSGSVRAALRGESRHPCRVGVYVGVSCMFSCSFCGRHRDARYSPQDVPSGNALFDQMVNAAPDGDPYTFYISGGLEPLTNPGLGDLVRAGAARGFKLSLYTNGFMLTPHLLQKQPGLWDLDALRISLYGANAAEAARVTQHDKAYDQVRRNAAQYLRLRNERRAATKFGFNFVLLHDHADQVLDIVEMIAEINREAQDAGGTRRQVDFLTLREDYSVPPDRGLSDDERARLVAMFAELENRRRHEDLVDLHVDFGYALYPESQGVVGQPLEMVNYADMRPVGYPQVSVAVDLLGDVYLYREAAFLERPGARRYVIGRLSPTKSLEDVVAEFLASGQKIEPLPGETAYFDIFDHVVTKLLNQADEDERFGVPFEDGPVRDRLPHGAELPGRS